MNKVSRRSFLEFLGLSSASLIAGPTNLLAFSSNNSIGKLKALAPSEIDELALTDGLSYEVLVKWGDTIAKKTKFGFNNDYTAFIPLDKSNPDDGLLWVNHEYIDARFVSKFFQSDVSKKSKKKVEKEMDNVGGSIIRVKRTDGKWQMVKNDPLNRRITAKTNLPFNWKDPIAGSNSAMGTLANCSGGITPWGSILTCEENYDSFYGERDHATGQRVLTKYDYGWTKYYDNPPEHYGWVVEIDPLTGKGQKHVALGRCAHECATVKELADGRLVVYSGDDAVNQFIYKFISSKPGSLSEGTLYVANTLVGKWISLKYEDQPVLQKLFKNQTEVLIRLREAAKYLGATPQDRPEDIEICPHNGDVLVALTNNSTVGNYMGSILKIVEKDGQHDALEFKAETFLMGGEENDFACPDNLAFDNKGNLWFTSDMSGSVMNSADSPQYLPFKNNSLFVVPKEGEHAGRPIRVANAPTHAEFTGPFFAPDGKSLFLSVQHPGEYTTDMNNLSSHWPGGELSIPKPSVVVIYGVDEIV